MISSYITKSTESSFVMEVCGNAFISGVSAVFSAIDLKKDYGEYVLLITKSNDDGCNKIRAFVFNDIDQIVVCENDTAFLLSELFLKDFGFKEISSISNRFVYQDIMFSLMRAIPTCDVPGFKINALANLLAASLYAEVIDNEYERIKNALNENVNDPNFNLDSLASLVYMSRRKIQYVLSRNNDTFLNALNKIRFLEMKRILDDNRLVYDKYLISRSCGFKNIDAANKVFKKNQGISIAEYVRSKHQF